jgi:hypothetical protein
MGLLIKATTTAALIATLSPLGAGAAPLGASLALRDALAPTSRTVQWRGGPYFGYDYDYDYGYYCPPYYGYYPSAYYGYRAPAYYGGYRSERYYRRYNYTPRVFGSYRYGY